MIGYAFINVGLLIAAGAYYFFLKKSSKIQDSKNASSAAQAFAQQTVQKHGLNLDAPLRTRSPALQHQANAPFHPQATMFRPLSPGSSFAVGKTNMSWVTIANDPRLEETLVTGKGRGPSVFIYQPRQSIDESVNLVYQHPKIAFKCLILIK